MGKKAKLDLTPELRAEMARMQERLRKSPLQTEEQRERLRQIGEYLGVTPQGVREFGKRLGIPRLPEDETAPPEPTAPQQKSRKPGGGNKQKLDKDEVERGEQTYRAMLDENPKKWRNQEAAANELIKRLKLGDRVSWQTVKRRIVAPVQKEPRAQNKRPLSK
jgi:hypothetical protein